MRQLSAIQYEAVMVSVLVNLIGCRNANIKVTTVQVRERGAPAGGGCAAIALLASMDGTGAMDVYVHLVWGEAMRTIIFGEKHVQSLCWKLFKLHFSFTPFARVWDWLSMEYGLF